MGMQEIVETRRDPETGLAKELRDKLVGLESKILAKQFTERRQAVADRLESGETQSAVIREHRRIGFEDDCPCGSTKQFKDCCGAQLHAAGDERIDSK